MKKNIMLLAAAAVTGCSHQPAPPQPQLSSAVGMPNPASVYCIQQSGTLERVQTAEGEIGYCRLPNGERIEEWTLLRRDRS